MSALLEIEDLRVALRRRAEAVRGVSFAMGRERLGIVGEIGRGQVADRPRHPAPAAAGRAHDRAARSRSTASISCAGARDMRGAARAAHRLVLQDPQFSLNPVMTRRRADRGGAARSIARSAGARRASEALALLEAVRIREPERVHRALSARALGRHGPARDDRDDAGAATPIC